MGLESETLINRILFPKFRIPKITVKIGQIFGNYVAKIRVLKFKNPYLKIFPRIFPKIDISHKKFTFVNSSYL